LSSLRRVLPLATLAIAISALYLYKLDAVGVLGPDEPRYASIGRNMAHTGDFVTPVLWGAPWFEKPPLLYWMTALGTLARLDPELSARLPVALLSLAFLAACFFLLWREFGAEAATVSTALLATSAGWITYSQLCLTDLPLAVFFSLPVFLALPLLREQPRTTHVRPRWIAIGVSLGLAVLAKGLVPIVLALPFFWFLRRYRRSWWLACLACAVIAVPWYVLAYLRNGEPFIRELFLRHHFERLYSPSLQHVQPWYYYVPVLLAGVFPWTPLLGLLTLRGNTWDTRRRFLASIIVFGFVFFTITLNKLPGYLLPLIPSLFVLIGAHFENRSLVQISRWWLLACALLIAAIPLFSSLLPQSLMLGRIASPRVAIQTISRPKWFYIFAPLIVVWLARRSWAGVLLVLCVVSGGIYLKDVAYPVLDREVSARSLWREMHSLSDRICAGWVNRDWMYGLAFYRGSLYPPCSNGKYDYALQSQQYERPVVVPLH
jgi:4-amino-4-deoxy-L-arabinose transferase-like glycosyltransferase